MSTPSVPDDDLRDVIDELYARAPESDIEPSLDRIAHLVTLLGDPHLSAPVIHVAGTNGKSSTARMIDALLRAAGLRVGLFTSPHLHSPTERITIDGQPVAEADFVALYEELRPYLDLVDAASEAEDGPEMTFFEVLTGMAFAAFADAPVDVIVLEVGLGGRWDATNVAPASVAVVTPIDLDHMDWLGSTLEQIAAEKAGVIKSGATAVIGGQPEAAAAVLLQRCAEVGATVVRAGLEFGVTLADLAVGGQMISVQGLHDRYDNIFLPLFGSHQADNAATAVAAVEAFLGPVGVTAELVTEGLGLATSPGRLEIIRRSPTVIVDAAHNPAGMAATVEALQTNFDFTSVTAVFAAFADKDITGLLGVLEPVAERIIVTRNSGARSAAAQAVGAIAEDIFGADRVAVAADMAEAIEIALDAADGSLVVGGSPAVLITGSVATVADARAILRAVPGEGR